MRTALKSIVWGSLCLLAAGCRPAPPPEFTMGEPVIELTAEIEDPEEKALYQQLQQGIMELLREKCGTPAKIKLLGSPGTDDGAGEGGPNPDLNIGADDTHLKQGYALYDRYCTQCHGVNGDGNGPVAEYLDPKPRNYKRGIFKFTSTPYGKKPRRSDLMRTVRRGVTGTSMPSFDRFSDEELAAVIDYVLALTLRGEFERELAMVVYDEEEIPDEESVSSIIERKLRPWKESANEFVMPVTAMPPMTEETVALGHKLFLKQACNKCHGKFGRGGSEGVEVGTDDWGYKAAAADLSSGMFRGGGRPVDLYRRIYSGINGTPMPAFGNVYQDNPDAIWHLVHFIKKTGERRRQGLPPLSEADLSDELEELLAETPSVAPPTEDEAAAEADSEQKPESEEAESTETSSEEKSEAAPAESADSSTDDAADKAGDSAADPDSTQGSPPEPATSNSEADSPAE